MSLEIRHRLLHLLTLSLSMLCLIIVEEPFLPTSYQYLFLLFGLVPIAFFTEGRWILPAWIANLVALAVAIGSVKWLHYNLTSPGSLFQHVAFPAVLVPYAGVVVLFLKLVLLFRSRGLPDYWRLQGLGLVQIAVACALAGPPIFGLLLLAYFASLLASMAAHHRLTCPVDDRSLHRPALTLAILGWVLAATGPALALAIITPRGELPIWDPYSQFGGRSTGPTAQVGYNEEIDLAETGEIALNEQLAFSVEAVDANGLPKVDLASDTRWRGGILDLYDAGKWKSLYRVFGIRSAGVTLSAQLPDLGPQQYFLSFRVQPQKAGGLFLAEPIRLGRGPVLMPVVARQYGPRRQYLFAYLTGTIVPLPVDLRREYLYQQVVAPADRPDRLAIRQMAPPYLNRLKTHGLPELQAWSRELLLRLANERRYGLRRDLVDEFLASDRHATTIPPHADKVAQALTQYLMLSGDYNYTLTLRGDDQVDPVIDFLCNTREGHCERFASGLTLMLRSLGVPARIVKGFRGAEHLGDGRYVIRQRFAHTWVEAVVTHDGDERGTRYDWLSLDPTPPSEEIAQRRIPFWTWLLERIRHSDQLWRDLIVDMRPDQQFELWAALAPLLIGAGALGLVIAIVRRLLSARQAVDPETLRRKQAPYYRRLVQVLGQYGGPQPSAARTPREFARNAQAFLQPTLAAELAELPCEAVELLYRQRYAGVPPEPEALAALNARLERLASLLELDAAARSLAEH